jgi:hypothetical protein
MPPGPAARIKGAGIEGRCIRAVLAGGPVPAAGGLRHDAHPLIQFLDGPSGRRASLLGRGLDVWEVIATIRDNNGSIAEAAEYLQIPAGLVEAAVAYYGEYVAAKCSAQPTTAQATCLIHLCPALFTNDRLVRFGQAMDGGGHW